MFTFDPTNNLNVNLAAGSISGGNAAASPTGAAVPASGDFIAVNIGGNLVGVTGLALGGTTKAADVAIVDGSGNQITSFGGGTQFADNTASGATPTGTLEMGWDSANSKVRALKVNASQALIVDGSAVTQPVSGTFFQATQPVSGTVTVIQGTGTNLHVVNDASAAVIGHVIADTGSTTAVTGNVTVVQPTGTNLHAVLDATSTTAVTQATAANLNATVVPSGTAIFEVSPTTAANTNANPFFNSITDGTTKATVIAATAALKTDLSSVAGTATSTAAAGVQLVGIEGRAGTSLETTAGVLDENIKNVGNAVVVTSAAGVQKVGISGNAAATLDSTIGAATAPTNALATSVVYQTTVPALTAGQAVAQQSDTTGSTYANVEGRKTTYRMAVKSFTPVASATSPTFSIQGSASKTVRITRIVVTTSCLTGTATPFKSDLVLQKFSALTGGTTGSTPTGTLMDSGNAAQTAICLQYSAVPTTATAIGGLTAAELIQMISATATANGITRNEFTFGDKNGQACVLRGTAQFLGITINPLGTTPLMSVTIEWAEDNS